MISFEAVQASSRKKFTRHQPTKLGRKMMVKAAVAGSKASDPLLLWERVWLLLLLRERELPNGRGPPNGASVGVGPLSTLRPHPHPFARPTDRPSVRSFAACSVVRSPIPPGSLPARLPTFLPTNLPTYTVSFLLERWLARAPLHSTTATPVGSPLANIRARNSGACFLARCRCRIKTLINISVEHCIPFLLIRVLSFRRDPSGLRSVEKPIILE